MGLSTHQLNRHLLFFFNKLLHLTLKLHASVFLCLISAGPTRDWPA